MYNSANRHAAKRWGTVLTAVIAALLVTTSACVQAIRPVAPGTPTSKQEASATAIPAAPAKVLAIAPEKATVGTPVEATAEGLAPGTTVDLGWETVDGGWLINDYYHFGGKKFTETTKTLGQAVAGADGRLSYRFAIPEDFGGVHNVVASANGVPLAKGGVDVTQSFEMSPREGPVGTMIELRAKGLGWRTMESTWVVNWDNHEVGWVSAISGRGTTVARFRATGPAGDHQIKVYSGYMGQSYLNYEQAPTAYLARPDFVFHTTAGGEVPSAYAEPYPTQPMPVGEGKGGAKLEIGPTQGPVGTVATLKGSGLPAGRTLSLTWQTWIGSRVTDSGFAPQGSELAKLTVGADGTLEAPVTIPDDLGGLHALALKDGDEEVATTHFAVETSIAGISPTSGPAGTPVTIHLKGVGWTEYDNILVANYDNAYMGYACGFNSQGDVVIHFTASGAPGVHLVDLYPGLYQGPKDAAQQLYRLPQLSYADDHPGNKIPALRFAFQVTE